MSPDPHSQFADQPSSIRDQLVNEANLGVQIKDGILTLEEPQDVRIERCSPESYARSAARIQALVAEMEIHFPGALIGKPPSHTDHADGILLAALAAMYRLSALMTLINARVFHDGDKKVTTNLEPNLYAAPIEDSQVIESNATTAPPETLMRSAS
jgi:hypothetical protein